MPVVEYAKRRPVGVTTLMAVGDVPGPYPVKAVALAVAAYLAARFLGFGHLTAAGGAAAAYYVTR